VVGWADRSNLSLNDCDERKGGRWWVLAVWCGGQTDANLSLNDCDERKHGGRRWALPWWGGQTDVNLSHNHIGLATSCLSAPLLSHAHMMSSESMSSAAVAWS
jgi:hypothetical protein